MSRVTDRRGAYFIRSAESRAADPLEFQRRFDRGRAYQSGQWRPIQTKAPAPNVTFLRARAR